MAKMLLPVNISRMVEKKLNQKIETKTSCSTSSDGAQIFNNDFITRSSNLLSTSPGVADGTVQRLLYRIALAIPSVYLVFLLRLC
jgi:hypothetical protein